MTEERTYTVRSFDKLDDETRAKVLERYRCINVDYDDWAEPELDDIAEQLAAAGFDGSDIQYSGFWSQGDGLSFAGPVDLAKWLKTMKLAGKYRALYNAAEAGAVYANIARSAGHYVHQYMMQADLELDLYPETAAERKRAAVIEEQADKVTEILLEDARDRAGDAYRQLESAYDAMTADDAVIDTIEANGYMFTAAGKID